MYKLNIINPKAMEKLEKFFSVVKTYEEYDVLYKAAHIMFGNCPVVEDEAFCNKYRNCFECWQANYKNLIVEMEGERKTEK